MHVTDDGQAAVAASMAWLVQASVLGLPSCYAAAVEILVCGEAAGAMTAQSAGEPVVAAAEFDWRQQACHRPHHLILRSQMQVASR